MLKVVDKSDKVHMIPPPSVYIREGNYGILCIEPGIPILKPSKKHD